MESHRQSFGARSGCDCRTLYREIATAFLLFYIRATAQTVTSLWHNQKGDDPGVPQQGKHNAQNKGDAAENLFPHAHFALPGADVQSCLVSIQHQGNRQKSQHQQIIPGGSIKIQPQQGKTHTGHPAARTLQAGEQMEYTGDPPAGEPHKEGVGKSDGQHNADPGQKII